MKIVQSLTLFVLTVASSTDARVLRGSSVDEDTAGIVGRPLTPVSVAGVARRNYRSLAAVDETDADAVSLDEDEDEDATGLRGRGIARVGVRRVGRVAVAGVAVAGTAAVVHNNRYNNAYGYYRHLAATETDADEDEAGIVGRPLSPVSVAGVARRNYRNLAATDEDEAGIVGHPLSPVSVAGVARRSVRRSSVYY